MCDDNRLRTLSLWLQGLRVPRSDSFAYARRLISIGFDDPRSLMEDASLRDLRQADVKVGHMKRIMRSQCCRMFEKDCNRALSQIDHSTREKNVKSANAKKFSSSANLACSDSNHTESDTDDKNRVSKCRMRTTTKAAISNSSEEINGGIIESARYYNPRKNIFQEYESSSSTESSTEEPLTRDNIGNDGRLGFSLHQHLSPKDKDTLSQSADAVSPEWSSNICKTNMSPSSLVMALNLSLDKSVVKSGRSKPALRLTPRNDAAVNMPGNRTKAETTVPFDFPESNRRIVATQTNDSADRSSNPDVNCASSKPRLHLTLPNSKQTHQSKISDDGSFLSDGFSLTPRGIQAVPQSLLGSTHNAHTQQRTVPSKGRGGMCDRRALVLLREIGRGASGTVHRAVHVPSLTLVAIKFVTIEDSQRRQHMVQELRALYTMSRHRLPASFPEQEDQPYRTDDGLVHDGMFKNTCSDNCSTFRRGCSTANPRTELIACTHVIPLSEATKGVADIHHCSGDTPCIGQSVHKCSICRTLYDADDGCEASPFIVKFFDAYTDVEKEAIGIVLEHMGGGSLQDFVNRGLTLDERGAAVVAYSVLSALQHMHFQQVIHRDVKPGNILCTSDGIVKLGDFGAMRELSESLNAKTFTGTVQYMSPERIRGEKYSTESDVWGLGLTLVTIVSGKFPFPTDRGYWGLLSSIQEGLPPNSLDNSNFSTDLRDFLSRCLDLDATSRASASELLKHSFLNGVTRVMRAPLVNGPPPPIASHRDTSDSLAACNEEEYKLSTLNHIKSEKEKDDVQYIPKLDLSGISRMPISSSELDYIVNRITRWQVSDMSRRQKSVERPAAAGRLCTMGASSDAGVTRLAQELHVSASVLEAQHHLSEITQPAAHRPLLARHPSHSRSFPSSDCSDSHQSCVRARQRSSRQMTASDDDDSLGD